MDARLTEDQVALRDALAERIRDRGPGWARQTMETRLIPDELWAQFMDGGFGTLLLSEDLGGLGLSLNDLAPLIEECGKELLSTVVADSIVAMPLLADIAHELPPEAARRFAARSLKATLWGFGEAEVGNALPEAHVDGDSWTLHGTYRRALCAESVDVALALVKDALGTQRVLAVPRTLFDGCATYQPSLGLADPLYTVNVDELRVPRRNEVTVPSVVRFLGHAFKLVRCLEMVGAADRTLARAVDYARMRVAFGKPIGSFQAIKHKCADMLLLLETARSACYYAAWCLANDHADTDEAMNIMENYCSSRLPTFGTEGIQINGGIGFTWEMDTHLYLRRLKQHQALLSYRSARARLMRALKQCEGAAYV
jgi:alkylation response protein AidB-like acyl-CoA dehydrogenase